MPEEAFFCRFKKKKKKLVTSFAGKHPNWKYLFSGRIDFFAMELLLKVSLRKKVVCFSHRGTQITLALLGLGVKQTVLLIVRYRKTGLLEYFIFRNMILFPVHQRRFQRMH